MYYSPENSGDFLSFFALRIYSRVLGFGQREEKGYESFICVVIGVSFYN